MLGMKLSARARGPHGTDARTGKMPARDRCPQGTDARKGQMPARGISTFSFRASEKGNVYYNVMAHRALHAASTGGGAARAMGSFRYGTSIRAPVAKLGLGRTQAAGGMGCAAPRALGCRARADRRRRPGSTAHASSSAPARGPPGIRSEGAAYRLVST